MRTGYAGRQMRVAHNKWLKRTARLSALVLLIGVIVLVISGWGITHTEIIYRLSLGTIDRRLADAIHRGVNAPLAVFLIIHLLVEARLSLSQRVLARERLVNVILVTAGIVLLALVLYMEYVA